jgi:O-antigen/teichoic acid export membrane protein
MNLWLIPLHGIIGAAVATSSAYILDVILKSIVFSFKYKVEFSEFTIIKVSDFYLYKNKLLSILKKR